MDGKPYGDAARLNVIIIHPFPSLWELLSGACCFLLIPPFYFFFIFSSPPSSPRSIVLSHWLHFSQCGYSQRTSAYRNIAWRDCVCVCVCVCVKRRDFGQWTLAVLCPPVLCLYWVSDPLGCSTHIQHPSLALSLSVFVSVFVSLLADLFPILFLSPSVFLFIHFLPPPSLYLQTEAANKYSNMKGAASETNAIGNKCRFMSELREVSHLFARIHQIKQHLRPLVRTCFPFPYMDTTNDFACVTSVVQFIRFTAAACFVPVFVLQYGNWATVSWQMSVVGSITVVRLISCVLLPIDW